MMIFRLLSRDKTLKNKRIMTTTVKYGAESLENCYDVFIDLVEVNDVMGSDGVGICRSNAVQANWIAMFANHSKSEWIKYTDVRCNKDISGGDQPTEQTFTRFRTWIRWKKGITMKPMANLLKGFLIEDDYIMRYTDGSAVDIICTCLRQLQNINFKK